MLEAHEVTGALESRRHDQRVLDTYGSLRPAYSDWHADVREVYRIYGNDFDVVWPDGQVSRGLPKIANFLQLASDDRAREIAATLPSLVCRAERAGDNAKEEAEKRERILQGYWERSRVAQMIPRLAHDAMSSGLTALLVWPDFAKPVSERYPLYRRFEPLRSYPEPIFTSGPYCDSFIYAYEANIREVEARFDKRLDWRKDPANTDKVRMVEYYDDTQITIVAEQMRRRDTAGGARREIMLQEAHKLACCPVVIGTRPTMDSVYRSEFLGGLGVTNTLNRMISMMLDDAFQKVYAPTTSWDIENPEEGGPGGHLVKGSKDASFEWVQPPNQPFTNTQLVRDLTGSARAANLIPPSRSGDPNESIISAAGISASQSQFVSDVRSIQRDVLAVMFEAANEIAFKADEAWGGKEPKPIYGWHTQREDYNPAKDIGGNYRNKVVYGMGSGLDEINQNVMVLQQLGGGLVSRRTAMEMSPFVEDPTREEKQMAIEQLDQATFAGLVAQAQQGLLDPVALAKIRKAVESDNTSLADAIEAFTSQAPLAPPQQTAPGAPPEAPGIAGAAEGQSVASNLPPLAELLG